MRHTPWFPSIASELGVYRSARKAKAARRNLKYARLARRIYRLIRCIGYVRALAGVS
jgi:hypothetical protein